MDVGLKRQQFCENWASRKVPLPGYSIVPRNGKDQFYPVPLKVRDSDGNEFTFPGIAQAFSVSSGAKIHNVIVGYSIIHNTFMMWCGDAFLEGGPKGLTTAQDKSLSETTNEHFAKIIPIAADAVSAANSYMSLIDAHKDSAPLAKSTGCNFWRNDRVCKHTQAVAAHLDLEAITSFLTAAAANSGFVAGSAGLTSSLDAVHSKLERYAFLKHVLMEGDKGSGKTVGAEAISRERGIAPITIYGHEGMEASDMLGHFLRMPDGSMAWKDGKLSEAFRRAADMEPTILIIDEILRIPQRQLSVLVSALSPGLDGNYRLSTGRPVGSVGGVITEEVLACHPSMFWVVATTNVGAGYAVEDMDSALSDRFRAIRVDTTEDKIRNVLESVLKERGFTTSLKAPLIAFWKSMSTARKVGELTRIVNLRHLCEAVTLARSPADLPVMLKDQTLVWVDRDTDGYPISAQVEFVEMSIDQAFKGASL